MQKRNVLNSPRLLELKKQRRKIVLNKVVLSVVAILVISGACAYLSNLKQLQISEIEVQGNKVVDGGMIKAAVEKEIESSYLWFFSRKNIFIYPKKEIEQELKRQFERIGDVDFSIKNNKLLEVHITERAASYTWCGKVPPDAAGAEKQKCYFMDDLGYIFDEAPYFSGEVYFKFYGTTDPDRESPLGTYVLKDDFAKLTSFIKIMKDMELRPASLMSAADGKTEIFLSSPSRDMTGPRLIFKIDSDLSVVAENLDTALNTEPLMTNFKSKYSSLEYIDLRYGNKVYYKFK